MFLKLDHAYSLTVKKSFFFYSKCLNSESLLGFLFEIAHRIFSIPMKKCLYILFNLFYSIFSH